MRSKIKVNDQLAPINDKKSTPQSKNRWQMWIRHRQDDADKRDRLQKEVWPGMTSSVRRVQGRVSGCHGEARRTGMTALFAIAPARQPWQRYSRVHWTMLSYTFV